MTRRPLSPPRPMSAEEFAALAGIELEPLEADDHRGTWTIREHSRWRRQWWPIAQSIATTLLYAAAVFIVTLVSLCLGRSLPLRRHMRLGPPRNHRPRH